MRRVPGTAGNSAPCALPESLQSVERYWDVHRSGTNVEGYYSDICVTKSYLTHLYRFFRRNGIRLGKVFPSLPTTAYVVMNEAERKGQTLLVDMGGYTTDFLLCNREIPVYMDSVPFGGMHITNEISLAINGSFDESERWKRFASCGCDLAQQKVFCQEVSRWLPLMDRPVPRGEHWTDEARLEVSAYYLLHSAREVLYNIFERVAAQRGTTSGEFYLLIAGGALGTLCGIEKLAAEIFRISGDRCTPSGSGRLGLCPPVQRRLLRRGAGSRPRVTPFPSHLPEAGEFVAMITELQQRDLLGQPSGTCGCRSLCTCDIMNPEGDNMLGMDVNTIVNDAKIRVVGVGGAGSNAVNRMIEIGGSRAWSMW